MSSNDMDLHSNFQPSYACHFEQSEKSFFVSTIIPGTITAAQPGKVAKRTQQLDSRFSERLIVFFLRNS